MDVSLTLDQDHRVVAVDLHRVDAVRTPAALDEAVQRAYRQAVVEQSRDLAPASAPEGRRPQAVATTPRRIPRSAELLGRHRIRNDVRAAGGPTGRPRDGVGVSRNGCVRVVLLPASPRGGVEADPGWLSQATATHISQAVQEAFRAAYDEKDR